MSEEKTPAFTYVRIRTAWRDAQAAKNLFSVLRYQERAGVWARLHAAFEHLEFEPGSNICKHCKREPATHAGLCEECAHCLGDGT